MLGEYPYELFSVAPGDLASFLSRADIGGLNVTIPYKQAVIPYCAQLSDTARQIGSVNTLLRRPDGTFWGHNTDQAGFLYMADRAGVFFEGRKVLIFGSGGTSRTVRAAVEARGGCPVVISRKGPDNYENLFRHRDAEVLVNTTPVGMYPHNGESVVRLEQFPACAGVLDAIYNPLRTSLVQQAAQRGVPASGGLPMLVEQARAAAEIFTGEPIPPGRTQEILARMEAQKHNIVLVGMPGCGKTTVGALLAQRMRRRFIDLDEEIVRRAGCTIPQLFQMEGESGFRAREAQVLTEAARESGLVIATGGGAPMFAQNREALRQNGWILFLQRRIQELPVEGRPLSQDLEEMFRRRAPVYTALADASQPNQGQPEEVAAAIERRYYEAFGIERTEFEYAGHS